MVQYKALMLDLDGTTIPNSPTGMPSQRVREAIKKAQERLSVCIVTGRFLFETEPILDLLHITTPVVLLGGCQIIDGVTRKFIYTRPFEEDDVHKILAIIKPYKKPIKIRETNRNIIYDSSYKAIDPINIYVTRLTEAMADEIASKLSHIPTITTHKVISWTHGEFCLSISHVYATKQHAIFEVAKLLGINSHEMIGVGDGPNDFPLLMACGLKVAMGNAAADLKAIADYIAPTVDEDGIADVIEKFILK